MVPPIDISFLSVVDVYSERIDLKKARSFQRENNRPSQKVP